MQNSSIDQLWPIGCGHPFFSQCLFSKRKQRCQTSGPGVSEDRSALWSSLCHHSTTSKWFSWYLLSFTLSYLYHQKMNKMRGNNMNRPANLSEPVIWPHISWGPRFWSVEAVVRTGEQRRGNRLMTRCKSDLMISDALKLGESTRYINHPPNSLGLGLLIG